MTREEVMEMAYESGMIAGYEGEPDLLERFAALVAAAEREACAKACDEKWIYTASPSEMAEYIRARSTP
jgi:hypothetical protein